MLKKLIEKIKAVCERRKIRIIGIDYGEPGSDHTEIAKIKVTTEEATQAIEKMGEAGEKAGEAMERLAREVQYMQKKAEKEAREKTNNWRKMHGLPMKRRRRRRGGRKGD